MKSQHYPPPWEPKVMPPLRPNTCRLLHIGAHCMRRGGTRMDESKGEAHQGD